MKQEGSLCWFCNQSGGVQFLSREWDCGYHLKCAQQAYQEGNPEAGLIADLEDTRVHLPKRNEGMSTRQYSWNKAADRVVEVNDANGFDRPTMENLPIKLMLVVTELEEAARSVEPGPDDDPLNEELADVAVRLLHILQSMWPNDWHLRVSDDYYYPPRTSPFKQIEVLLWPILIQCCKAAESWRKKYEIDVQIYIEYALAETLKLSRRLGYDLLEEAYAKVEKNAKRGHLHGKARPEG